MILEGFKKINEEQITRVENTLNISFPLDYKILFYRIMGCAQKVSLV